VHTIVALKAECISFARREANGGIWEDSPLFYIQRHQMDVVPIEWIVAFSVAHIHPCCRNPVVIQTLRREASQVRNSPARDLFCNRSL